MGKVHYQVVMTYYRLMRKLRSAGVEPSPQQLRVSADRLGALTPMPMGTKLEMTELNGVPSGIVSYSKKRQSGIIFFVHGGGFAFGSTKTHRSAVARLAKFTGCLGVIPEYRLTPEHPYPAPLEDCVAAYEGLVKRYPEEDIFVFGDSAGGNLAVETVLSAQKLGLKLPSKVVLMSPWLDLSPDSESIQKNKDGDSLFDKTDLLHYSRMYLADSNPYDETISPLRADLGSFPKTLIQVAKNELLYFDSKHFSDRLNTYNVPHEVQEEENLFHSWQLFPDLVPEAYKSLQLAADFVLDKSDVSLGMQK